MKELGSLHASAVKMYIIVAPLAIDFDVTTSVKISAVTPLLLRTRIMHNLANCDHELEGCHDLAIEKHAAIPCRALSVSMVERSRR